MSLQSEPITVGLLFSQTGVTSVVEETQRRAVLLAMKEINAAGGVLDRPLKVMDPDPASSPRRFAKLAEQLISSGVDSFFGCYMSSTRRAVLPVLERSDALLFYPTLYEGFEFSPHCIYSGAAPNQNSALLADFAAENLGERYYFVGSNYVFPYESNRIMRDLIQSRGGSVLEERYIPLQPAADDIGRVMDEIKNMSPDVVFSTVVGDGAKALYRAYETVGFDRALMPILSLTTGEPEVAAMGSSAAEGHYTSAPYFSSINSPANHAFVAAYRGEYGSDAPISACTEAAYFQVYIFAEAVRRAGSTNRADVLRTLPTFEFSAPQGKVRIDGRTQHTYLHPRIGRVNCAGGFDIVEEERMAIRPDPYMIDPKSADWSNIAAGL